MELRKTEETEIGAQEVTVRSLANKAYRVKRGAGAAARGARKTVGRALWAGGHGAALAKRAAMSGASGIPLSGLTREQKKQWDSYSIREQKRILEAASKRAERRMRYGAQETRGRLGRRGLSPGQESKYHTGASRKKRAIQETTLREGKVYRSPALPADTVKRLRLEQAKKRFRKERERPPRLKQLTGEELAASWKQAAPAFTQLTRKNRQAGRGLPWKSAALEEELSLLAEGRGGHRRVVRLAGDGRGREKKKVFYEPDNKKAEKRARKAMRAERKQAIRERKRYNQYFRSQILETLDGDARKSAGIRQAQRQEQIQISMADLEWETAGSVLRTALFPARVPLEAIKAWAARLLRDFSIALLKYAAILLLPLFLLLFVLLVLMGILSGIAGGEAAEQEYGAAYGASGYEIVEYAKEWIGVTRYVWGAGRDDAQDWQDFADCSSFAHGVYAHFGYEIGWDTYVQELSGTVVEGGLENALPGDFILFYSGSIGMGRSSHIGIYAGDGQMVHCSGGVANTYANPGRGVCMGSVTADGRPYEVRRVVTAAPGGGEELLAYLAKYNIRLETDREKGIKWWYTNRGAPGTWNAASSSGAKKATNCALLVRWALKEMGVIENDDFFYYSYGNTFRWKGDTEAHLRANADILAVRRTARAMIADGTLQPGDICCWHSIQHINVYAGGNKWYDAGRGGTNGHWENFGHLDSSGWEERTYVFDKWGPVPTGYLDTQVDYIIRIHSGEQEEEGTTSGHRRDPTAYTQDQLELIWAIVAQEDNGSYAGALAVISSAMNRTESLQWKYLGSTALSQLTASGQYCYSNDHYWEKRLGGNVPGFVREAVSDCLKRGIRNHPYTSFRSQKGSQTGPDAVQIGGNWYFGS